MNEIKVTVSYEKPTTSKFDALMAEYEAAKKMADEKVSYYKPLADAAEEAKMDAILEQIEPIIEYTKQLAAISNSKVYINAHVSASESGYYELQTFSLTFHPEWDSVIITWNHMPFNKERLKKYPEALVGHDQNILGNWDKWNMYKSLENDAIRKLKTEIEKQHNRGEKQINRLNNIQGV
jgi:hypothetical protein